MKPGIKIRNWHWEITRRCNLKCLHCIIGDYSGYEMTTEQALNAISSIVKLGGERLFITGGEPLMRDDLCKIIRRAHDSGLAVSLITNGTKINKLFLKKVKGYLQNLAVSIDGESLVQDKIRGKGVYNKCVAAIKLITGSGIENSVYVTIQKLNENHLGDLVEKMIALGVRSFHFNEINPEGRARDHKELLLTLEKTAERARLIFLQLQNEIVIKSFLSDSKCSISRNEMYLQSNGNIFACVEMAFKMPQKSIANILIHGIEELKEGVNSLFSKIECLKTDRCCYTLFFSPGISICLNENWDCPVIRRLDNG